MDSTILSADSEYSEKFEQLNDDVNNAASSHSEKLKLSRELNREVQHTALTSSTQYQNILINDNLDQPFDYISNMENQIDILPQQGRSEVNSSPVLPTVGDVYCLDSSVFCHEEIVASNSIDDNEVVIPFSDHQSPQKTFEFTESITSTYATHDALVHKIEPSEVCPDLKKQLIKSRADCIKRDGLNIRKRRKAKYKSSLSNRTQSVICRANETKGAFSCEECNRSFNFKHHLARHNRIHTGDKPFTCDVCSTTFRDQSSLRNHIMIHNDERPFHCTYCNRYFRRKQGFESHCATKTHKDNMKRNF